MLEAEIRQRIENLRLMLLEQDRPCETAGRAAPPLSIQDIRGVREAQGRRGKCLIIEKQVGRHLRAEDLKQAARRLLGLGQTTPSFVFLDLETTGFSATPLFLAGTIFERAGSIEAQQILARDYSEEGALIDQLDAHLSGFQVCITFNGKSFDIPYIRERAKYHRIDLVSKPEQFDLLHVARRKWKRRLPNCRLLTLEWHVLGRRRIGDIPGWEVPCIYHEFVHTKDARRLKNVLRHNLVDILSMAELFVSLAEATRC